MNIYLAEMNATGIFDETYGFRVDGSVLVSRMNDKFFLSIEAEENGFMQCRLSYDEAIKLANYIIYACYDKRES